MFSKELNCMKNSFRRIKTNLIRAKKLIKTRNRLVNSILNLVKIRLSHRKSSYVKTKPWWIQIEPTNKCNLDCEFCARKNTPPIGDMKLYDFKKILKHFDSTIGIVLQGNGEPFLNPDIFKMIKYAKKCGFIVNTVSNGTLLTQRVCDRIIDSELGGISISIDDYRKKGYERIRKGSNFELVCKNVKRLVKTRNKENSDLRIYIVSVLTNENIHLKDKFENFGLNLGVDDVLYQHITSTSWYPKSNLKLQLPNLKLNLNKCTWIWNQTYIGWNGKVSPCCQNYLDFGNIFKTSFHKIWNNEKYRKFREMFMKGQLPSSCVGCSVVLENVK